MPGLLLDTLNGQQGDRRPIWLMRQAGRYLPEYRALRESKGGFLELVYDSAAAAEITLQPVRRFGFDGAILFSDILIVPHALGQDLAFLAGEGPRLSPPVMPDLLDRLEPDHSRFEPIYETVRRTRADLPEGVTMLGFAGSPWTVATYMVQGEGSRDQAATRLLATRDPGGFSAIMERIVASSGRSRPAHDTRPGRCPQITTPAAACVTPPPSTPIAVRPSGNTISSMMIPPTQTYAG